MSRRPALLVGLLALACSQPTEAIVRVDGVGAVRNQTERVELEIFGGPGGTEPLMSVTRRTVPSPEYPIQFTLAPRDGDARRRFRVRAVAHLRDGSRVNGTLESNYVAGRSIVVDLQLSEACSDVVCGGGERCVDGACEPLQIPDAGPLPEDAGPPPEDTGPADAGPDPVDAGPDPIDAGAVDAGSDPMDAGPPPVDAGGDAAPGDAGAACLTFSGDEGAYFGAPCSVSLVTAIGGGGALLPQGAPRVTLAGRIVGACVRMTFGSAPLPGTVMVRARYRGDQACSAVQASPSQPRMLVFSGNDLANGTDFELLGDVMLSGGYMDYPFAPSPAATDNVIVCREGDGFGDTSIEVDAIFLDTCR